MTSMDKQSRNQTDVLVWVGPTRAGFPMAVALIAKIFVTFPVAGFHFDAVKHFSRAFLADFLRAVPDEAR